MQPSAKLTLLGVILFPIVLLLLFANALLFDPTIYHALLAPEAVPVTLQLLDYFNSKTEVPAVFNEREQLHLADVKRVIRAVHVLSFALFIILLMLLSHADPSRVFSRGFIFLLVLLGVLAILPFNLVFEHFHQFAFEPGSWIFPAESMLIRLYPVAFFRTFFHAIVTFAVVFGAILGLWGRTSLVQHNKA